MPTREVRFDLGFVNSKDPHLLANGELITADDSEYKPNDPGLHKVSGRTKFLASPEADPITGLVGVSTPVAEDEIIWQTGTTLRKAATGLTGAATTLFSGLTGSNLLTVSHFDRHAYLYNGVDRNRVYGADFPTGGFHGMVANTNAPTDSGDGAGAGFTLALGAVVTYWIEEQVRDPVSGAILKRNSSTTTENLTITGDGGTETPRINQPTTGFPANPDTTHWAVQATVSDGVFPVGGELDSKPIATTFIDDLRTNALVLPSGPIYLTFGVTLRGIVQLVPRFGPPPISDTTTTFEDAFVGNDSTNPEIVRFSFPGNYHALPATNTIFIGDGQIRHRVKLIRKVNDNVVILTDKGGYRITTLPQSADLAFQPERIITEIEGAFGATNPEAGDLFTFGEGSLLAYVSPSGIHATDGYKWDILTEDIDWENTVDTSKLNLATLKNDPQNYRLIFVFTPKGSAITNSKHFFLHYHPSHVKTGQRVKVSGPNSGVISTLGRQFVSGIQRVFSGNPDGNVYVEREGNTDTSGVGIAFTAELPERYFNGFDGSVEVEKFFLHHSAGAATQTIKATLTAYNEGKDKREKHYILPISRREPTSRSPRWNGQGVGIRVTNSDSLGSFRLNGIVFEGKALEDVK